MVRNAKTNPPTESSATEEAATSSGATLLNGGMGAIRELLNGSLAAAQNVAAWLEQSQKLNAQAVNTWHENLNAALREVEQADDLQKLMSVTTHLANRQMGTAFQQFGASVKQALETEAQWVERMRSASVGVAQRMLHTGVPASSGDGADSSPLTQLGQAQAEWLAMTQRWIDSVKSVQGQHH
ncbi:MAG: hypothetical protein QFE16_07145 [Pseudomonadota bacterium]|nr:hypothetical protein [Pseudomonadota bacterium]